MHPFMQGCPSVSIHIQPQNRIHPIPMFQPRLSPSPPLLPGVQPLDSFATADKNGCQIHPFFTASGPTIEILAGYDPAACLDRCHLFPDCVGFVAVPRQRMCWLKREISTLTSDEQSVVWRRCEGLNELTEKSEACYNQTETSFMTGNAGS